MEYKTIAGLESISAQDIGIKIQLRYNRELTDDERWEAQRLIEEFSKKLNRNTMLNDPAEQRKIKDERESILALFSNPVYVREIQNEYWKESVYPWFLVTTHKGVIKIGWRKRVINIDWKESDIIIDPKDVTTDDVTKGQWGDKYIHAWGYEKAKEYLDKLLA